MHALLYAVSLTLSVATASQLPLVNTHPPSPDFVRHCGAAYPFPKIACIHRHGAVIHGDFKRTIRNVIGDSDKFRSTSMPGEPSFSHVTNASFIIWEPRRGLDILGPAAVVDFMFLLANVSHEAPVYSPLTNELYFSRLQSRFLPQLVVNLTADPPTLKERLASPPVYAATGARYSQGLIYYSTIGGDEDIDGRSFRPGIYTLNVTSGESTPLLNNYHGYYFNAADDLDIDAHGRIWFTDDYYGRPCKVNTQAPQINPATYRFDPSTGSVVIAEDSLDEPNGVAFSPDGKTLYLTDTGAGSAIIDPAVDPAPGIHYNTTGKRTIYAYDLDPSGKRLLNKRPLHLAMDYAPDGIKVSREGFIIAATGFGIVVLDTDGELLVQVQTNFTVINIAWAGPDADELWAVGKGGSARIRWALRGPIIT
ncbi:Six-bladed beta-propeller TolB-like protein [Macrophomina phaseolina MS6]|uniref:Six-bladed beta-propeller TolB-like protein n=2 Tax=Macrophomina phaseolina TaxID=35725 RepID=K2S401_MACPH|nr:Six-bladed beta-propeller TolB-like protein [Macrophomina phaseolina MS6]KAH7010924.1 putative gluconolactonase precursor [Macrophomina phaseolina]